MAIRLTIATALVTAVAVTGCGDDAERRAATGPAAAVAAAGQTVAAPDADRYCALVRRLDADGERFFAGLGQDATPADYERAERRFIEAREPQLAELESVAPAPIRADVLRLLGGMRVRAGLPADPPVTQGQARRAEDRVKAFERRACAG